jgi:ABC-type branched-subunit amino acid transport system substrate-binding protein
MRRTRSHLLPLLLFLLSACTPAGGPESGPGPEAAVEPAIASGPSTSDDRSATARLLDEARDAVARRDWAGAAAASRTVVDRYAAVPGSSEALRILARASLETGDLETARVAAEQTTELFGAGNPRHAEGQLVLGEVDLAEGDTLRAAIRLASLPPGAEASTVADAKAILVELTPTLDAASLDAILRRVPSPSPPAVPLLIESGVTLHFQGDASGAAAAGQSALALNPSSDEARVAQALVDGTVEEILGRAPLLAALLPATGPPSLTEFGTLLEEGVQVAIEMEREGARRPAQLRTLDDGGSVQGAVNQLQEAERTGASAFIGPLLDDALAATARNRRRAVPMISPTARNVPEGVPAVYSLSGPDPRPARMLADYAARSGLSRVVLMYPRIPSSSFEADAFRAAFESAGGTVLRELAYPAGTTYFENDMRQVEELVPDALVLPLQAPDIELVAPQVTFFGLDTLGVRVLGTSEWGRREVLDVVDPRHTNGVVTVSPFLAGRQPPAATEFQTRYEALHRKTLRSNVPALGFDAARILLEALSGGARSAEDLDRELSGLRNFPGATGTFSVEDGLLVREHFLVRLENRTMLPVIVP